jgi:hypothetical protein
MGTCTMRFSGFLGLALALTALGGGPIAGDAQQPLHDHRNAEQVDVQKVVTLRFQKEDIAPNNMTQVFRLPDGGWGATSNVFRGVIPLFSSTGSPTGTLGRHGAGPGEFKGPLLPMAVGKELWVVDSGNNRITTFGPHGAVVGDRTLPGAVFWVQPAADERGLLLSGYFPDRHYVARATMDKANDRFGGDWGTSKNAWAEQHLAAAMPSGDVWAVARAGGRIDILRADNLELLTSTRLPDDLSQPEAHPATSSADHPAAPRLYAVMADSDGILWIVIWLADAHWRPGLNPRADMRKILDTVVLAVSTPDRAIIGEKRMDRMCVPVLANAGRLVSCANEGAATIDVLRLSLQK